MILVNYYLNQIYNCTTCFFCHYRICSQMAGDQGNGHLLIFSTSVNEVVQKKLLKNYNVLCTYCGLGCYFAALIGSFGASIAVGYLKTFVIYTVVAVVFYFVMYTLYAFFAGGKYGVKTFLEKCTSSNINITCNMFKCSINSSKYWICKKNWSSWWYSRNYNSNGI